MSADPAAVEAYAGARALVFGATGFIGGHIARALDGAGAEVALSARDAAALEELATALAGPATILPVDIRSETAVREAVRDARPHITFNLAGYGVDRTERDEELAEIINARFPGILCEAIAEFRDPQWAGQALIHAGSQLEYGPVGGDLAEDGRAEPHTRYGRTKLDGTLAVVACSAAKAVPALVGRLFSVYGPGEHEGRLLPTLVSAARSSGAVDLTDGRQRADFTWIGDVVEGLLRLGLVPAIGSAQTEPGGMPADRVVNLATGRLVSVREFVEEAADALGLPAARLRFGALPQRAETLEYEPVTNARLRALTGWSPGVSVAEAIRLMERKEERTHG